MVEWKKVMKQKYILCAFQVFLLRFWKNWQNFIKIKRVAIWKLRQVQHFPSKTLLVIVIFVHNYISSIFFLQWMWWPDVLYYVFVASLRGIQAAGDMFSGICSFSLGGTRSCSPGLLLCSWPPGLRVSQGDPEDHFLVCSVESLLAGKFFPVSHLTLFYSY